MSIREVSEFEAMKAIGTIVGNCLSFLKSRARPGMSSQELDEKAGKFFAEFGARSAPRSVYNFPGETCISIGRSAVHGVPGNQLFEEGEIVNIDVSAEKDGFFADTGSSFVIGGGGNSGFKRSLCEITEKARDLAIRSLSSGDRVNKVGQIVEDYSRKNGLSVIRNLGGHGVGHSLHEEPSFIANYYDRKDRRLFSEGDVVAIEPILSNGATELVDAGDGWTLHHPTYFTAQSEHTVMIGKDRPFVFTQPDRDY